MALEFLRVGGVILISLGEMVGGKLVLPTFKLQIAFSVYLFRGWVNRKFFLYR